jgi:hypothetical protein
MRRHLTGLAALVLALAAAACGAPPADEPIDVGRIIDVARADSAASGQAGSDGTTLADGSPGAAGTTGGTTAGAAVGGTGAVAPGAPTGGAAPTSGGGGAAGGGAAGAGGSGGGGGTAAAGAGGAAPDAAAPAGGGGGGPAAAPAAGLAPGGRGVSDTEIRIGFQVSEGLTEAFGAVGYDSDPPPDERLIVDALVRWVNEQGGIAGRQVVPVVHGTNPLDGNFAAQAQAACAAFTEDDEVAAVGTTPVAGSDALASCLASRQTPTIEHNFWPFTERRLRELDGYIYQPGRMSAERGWTSALEVMAGDGFFDGARLGIVRYDHQLFADISDRIVKPKLAELGVAVEAEEAVSMVNTASDVGSVSGQLNNVIVQFRAAGITHVIFVEWQGSIPFFFLPQAEAQGWRPQYGLVSFSNPSTVSKQSPAEQLANTVGAGWNPAGDTLQANYPENPAAARCLEIMQAAGLVSGYTAQGYYMFPHCDTVFFLQQAFGAASEITPAGLQAAAASLGTGYRSPQSLGSRFGPGRVDGSAGMSAFGFDAACGCFAFRGPVRDVP